MTYEEAKEAILKPKTVITVASVRYGKRHAQEVCKKVLEALDKQIPKKPIKDEFPWAICSVCGGSIYLENVLEHLHNEETFYCEHCGQALDWESEEKK